MRSAQNQRTASDAPHVAGVMVDGDAPYDEQLRLSTERMEEIDREVKDLEAERARERARSEELRARLQDVIQRNASVSEGDYAS